MNVFGVISKIFSAKFLMVNSVTAKTLTKICFEFCVKLSKTILFEKLAGKYSEIGSLTSEVESMFIA
jgi:hypothetical protein